MFALKFGIIEKIVEQQLPLIAADVVKGNAEVPQSNLRNELLGKTFRLRRELWRLGVSRLKLELDAVVVGKLISRFV